MRVPYALLGRPEKILAGAWLMKKRLPIDGVPWRVLDLAGAPLPEAAAAPQPAPPVTEPPAPAPPEPMAESVVAPAAVPPPPRAAPALAPRVNLPRRSLPEKSEANEPVRW